jgi:hypothetical protein
MRRTSKKRDVAAPNYDGIPRSVSLLPGRDTHQDSRRISRRKKVRCVSRRAIRFAPTLSAGGVQGATTSIARRSAWSRWIRPPRSWPSSRRKTDALLGVVDDQYFLIKYKGGNPAAMRYADFGANIVGMDDPHVGRCTIRKNPDLVKRFVRATAKSWEDARKRTRGSAVDAADEGEARSQHGSPRSTS